MKKFLICFIPLLVLSSPGDLKGETAIDRQVKRIIRERDSNDTKVFKIERWVRDNIRFYSDNEQFNMDERWTMPTETFQRRKGDCEDGAILIMCFAVSAGVPGDRVRLYAPVVTSEGMHASVAYKRESDDQWVWVEWTLNKAHSLGDIANRPVMKDVGIIPLGPFLEVTSLNPFHMKWLMDKEWETTSQELLGNTMETGE
jgi:hypothetical protein